LKTKVRLSEVKLDEEHGGIIELYFVYWSPDTEALDPQEELQRQIAESLRDTRMPEEQREVMSKLMPKIIVSNIGAGRMPHRHKETRPAGVLIFSEKDYAKLGKPPVGALFTVELAQLAADPEPEPKPEEGKKE